MFIPVQSRLTELQVLEDVTLLLRPEKDSAYQWTKGGKKNGVWLSVLLCNVQKMTHDDLGYRFTNYKYTFIAVWFVVT